MKTAGGREPREFFPEGARVRLSTKGMAAHLGYLRGSRCGTVRRRTRAQSELSIRVRWDGRKTDDLLHYEFLELVT
jgi:hypothetical protein